MLPLRRYGKVAKEYRGNGKVIDQAPPLSSTFHAVQFADGKSFLDKCTYRQSELDPSICNDFAGSTREGYQIHATHLIATSPIQRIPITSQDQQHQSFKRRFLCREVTVCGMTDTLPAHIRFQLVNLTLESIELSLCLGSRSILLRRVSEYTARMQELKVIRNIDVTCEVVASLTSLEEIDLIEKDITNLCRLLSLARGTVVNWVNYEVWSEDEQLLVAKWRTSFTRNFVHLYLIEPKDSALLQTFVEQAFPRLMAADDDWDIMKAIIAYLESRSETTVLEQRSLNLAVCMEILRERYLKRTGHTHILPPEIFEPAIEKIKEDFRKALEKNLGPLDPLTLEMFLNKVSPGINYYSFGRTLKALCNEIQFYSNKKDRDYAIRTFLAIRNDLVHRGAFTTNDKLDKTIHQQWAFLDEFVGKFLLAILGYNTKSFQPGIRNFVKA